MPEPGAGSVGATAFREKLIEQFQLQLREGHRRRGVRLGAIDHRHPEDPPTQNATGGDHAHEALGGAQPGFLDPAAGLEDFVEDLDPPAQRVPLELFDGLYARGDRQIGDQRGGTG